MHVLGSHLSAIFLFSFKSSSRTNLSYVSSVALFLLRSSGSMLVWISQALVGVVFIAPETNLSAWFCTLSSCAKELWLAMDCSGRE